MEAFARSKGRKEVPSDGGLVCGLPTAVWYDIAKRSSKYDYLALSLTCRSFRNLVKELCPEGKLTTDLTRQGLLDRPPCFTPSWFEWVYEEFERKEGCAPMVWRFGKTQKYVYDSDLLYIAAYQGCLESARRLMRKGVPLDINDWKCIGRGASAGGQIEFLRWAEKKGCPFTDFGTCAAAARGGHLATLKWLRTQDPPCPWDSLVCSAAGERNLCFLHFLC